MSDTDTSPAPSADEQPKRAIAKRVVSGSRRYFSPTHGASVIARSIEESLSKLDKKVKTKKEGDE